MTPQQIMILSNLSTSSSDTKTSPEESQAFLSSVSLPKLTKTQSESMDTPFPIEEITKAILSYAQSQNH